MSRHPLRPAVVGVVAAGGAAGALLRYGLVEAFPGTAGGFPWTVFAINVLGCALLAALPRLAVVRERSLLPPLLGAGVLGGFTTLSTYAEEARALVAGGHVGTAAAYVVGTLAAGLVAVAAVGRLETPASRARCEAEEGDA